MSNSAVDEGICCRAAQKGQRKSKKPAFFGTAGFLNSFWECLLTSKAHMLLAPRPGLEPGTYGLTVKKNQRLLTLLYLQLLDITAFFLSGVE
jgi:hypothetical protein